MKDPDLYTKLKFTNPTSHEDEGKGQLTKMFSASWNLHYMFRNTQSSGLAAFTPMGK